jgi:hypothetical protein
MLTLSKYSLESGNAPDEAVEIDARLRKELAPELTENCCPPVGLWTTVVHTMKKLRASKESPDVISSPLI